MAGPRPVKPMSKRRSNSTNRSADYRSRWSGSKKVRTFPLDQRRPWIESNHDELSIVAQCRLTGVSRSGLYYAPVGESAENIALMRLLDEQYTRTPYYAIASGCAILLAGERLEIRSNSRIGWLWPLSIWGAWIALVWAVGQALGMIN